MNRRVFLGAIPAVALELALPSRSIAEPPSVSEMQKYVRKRIEDHFGVLPTAAGRIREPKLFSLSFFGSTCFKDIALDRTLVLSTNELVEYIEETGTPYAWGELPEVTLPIPMNPDISDDILVIQTSLFLQD